MTMLWAYCRLAHVTSCRRLTGIIVMYARTVMDEDIAITLRKLSKNMSTPTDIKPSECRYYVDMLGYCELRYGHSWAIAHSMCPWADACVKCDCLDYAHKEKNDDKINNNG